MPESDITFTFDASEFKTAMDGISKNMGSIAKNTQNVSKKMGQSMGKTITALGLKFGLIIGAIKGMASAAKNFIPEIGMTFQIAGNIFLKNFLQPLRMQLLPILNRILKWFRDNRSVFVKLGGVFLNALKTAVQLLKTIFSLLKKALQPIIDIVKKALGGTVNDIGDAINLILVKIVAFAIFLEDLLAPVFGGLGDLIQALIGWVEQLGAGLTKGFLKFFEGSDIMRLTQRFAEFWQSLLETFKFLEPAVFSIAEAFGQTLGVALNIAIDAVVILIGLLELLFDLLDPSKRADAFKKFGERFKEDILQGATAGTIEKIIEDFKAEKGIFATIPIPGSENVDDVIITKTGRVLKTSPEDTIIATKGGVPGAGGGPVVNMTFGDVNLTVTEGNAQTAGENFINGIERGVRNSLLNSLASEAG